MCICKVLDYPVSSSICEHNLIYHMYSSDCFRTTYVAYCYHVKFRMVQVTAVYLLDFCLAIKDAIFLNSSLWGLLFECYIMECHISTISVILDHYRNGHSVYVQINIRVEINVL